MTTIATVYQLCDGGKTFACVLEAESKDPIVYSRGEDVPVEAMQQRILTDWPDVQFVRSFAFGVEVTGRGMDQEPYNYPDSDINEAELEVQIRCVQCQQVRKVKIIREDLESLSPNEDGTYTDQIGECAPCLGA